MSVGYLQLSQALIGIYLVLDGLEWTVLSSSNFIKGFFDKEAFLLRLQDKGFTLKYKSTDLFKKIPLLFSITIVLSGLILILFSIINTTSWIAAVLIFVIFILFKSIIGFGLEGSDQMGSIILFCLMIRCLVPQSEKILQTFILVQIMLSFVVSGTAKLVSKDWRGGNAIVMILSTHSFGIGSCNWLRKNKIITQFICWSVILFEVSWIALPFNNYLAFALLCLGLIFHLVNSFLMGLNLFLWSFAAAYPWVLARLSLLK